MSDESATRDEVSSYTVVDTTTGEALLRGGDLLGCLEALRGHGSSALLRDADQALLAYRAAAAASRLVRQHMRRGQ